jgi:hypothetical protein
MTILAATAAALIFVAMGAFQVSLAAGAPLGAHVLGGGHPGTLPLRLRLFSGIAAVLLLGFAVVALARAGAIGSPAATAGLLAVGCWAVPGFLLLNTLGNLASKSRIEQTLFAAATATLALLSGFVALTA